MNIKKTESKNLITSIAVLTCLVIASSLLLGFVFPKQVTIIDSGSEVNVMTQGKTVEDVLKEKNITLNEGDLISPSNGTQIKDGGTITIKRLKNIAIIADGFCNYYNTTADTAYEAVLECGVLYSDVDRLSCDKNTLLKNGMTFEIIRAKHINLTVGNTTHHKYTHQANVSDFLAEAGIYLEALDEITPKTDTPITDGINIVITKVSIGNETYEEAVARNVITKESSEHKKSVTIVEKEGADGLSKNTYNVTRRNGEVVSKTLVSSEVITAPVDKIVTVGTKEENVIASRGGVRYKKVLQCTATAYEPGYPGITATGRKAGPGIIAVDPRVIPLGSRVFVESTDDGKSWTYGYAIAADTGGAIKGNKVDLCYNTRSECIQFGRRQCNVYILE